MHDQQGSPLDGEKGRMRAKRRRTKLTERGMRRLLQKSMTNYRDLTTAIMRMWTRLQPRMLPGTVPEMNQPRPNGTPVVFVEMMTAAILRTLDAHERVGNVKPVPMKWRKG
jgi:hypothetical protein